MSFLALLPKFWSFASWLSYSRKCNIHRMHVSSLSHRGEPHTCGALPLTTCPQMPAHSLLPHSHYIGTHLIQRRSKQRPSKKNSLNLSFISFPSSPSFSYPRTHKYPENFVKEKSRKTHRKPRNNPPKMPRKASQKSPINLEKTFQNPRKYKVQTQKIC